MIRVRKATDRGHANYGWLDTYHSFSFADYYDPRHMGFRALRVINEDRVQPGRGFGMHPHRDMEIITYVLDGSLAHRDSLGTGSIIRAGELQRMTAGTGIVHSETNPSDTAPVQLYQIWILPDQDALSPAYEQRDVAQAGTPGALRLVASKDGRDGSLTVHQDVNIYLAALEAGERVGHNFEPGRHAWLQVTRGRVELDGHSLFAGDGAALSGERALDVRSTARSEVMLFDLA